MLSDSCPRASCLRQISSPFPFWLRFLLLSSLSPYPTLSFSFSEDKPVVIHATNVYCTWQWTSSWTQRNEKELLFIQQIFIEHLLSISLCSRHWLMIIHKTGGVLHSRCSQSGEGDGHANVFHHTLDANSMWSFHWVPGCSEEEVMHSHQSGEERAWETSRKRQSLY